MSSKPGLVDRSGADASESYRKHNISKWTAVALLVATLVVAALAIYFGYQAWQAGIDFNGNIPNLMASIPFDVTFLIGCTTTVVGIAATIYSIYHFHQIKKPHLAEQPKAPDLTGSSDQPIGPMTPQSYIALAKVVALQTKSGGVSLLQTQQLTDNYSLMLETLPEIPKPIVKFVVQELYKNEKKEELLAAVERAIENSTEQNRDALASLIETLQAIQTESLMSIFDSCIGGGMSDEHKQRLHADVKIFIWSFAVQHLPKSDDDFGDEVEKILKSHMLNTLKGVPEKAIQQACSAILHLKKHLLSSAVNEIEVLRAKLDEKRGVPKSQKIEETLEKKETKPSKVLPDYFTVASGEEIPELSAWDYRISASILSNYLWKETITKYEHPDGDQGYDYNPPTYFKVSEGAERDTIEIMCLQEDGLTHLEKDGKVHTFKALVINYEKLLNFDVLANVQGAIFGWIILRVFRGGKKAEFLEKVETLKKMDHSNKEKLLGKLDRAIRLANDLYKEPLKTN